MLIIDMNDESWAVHADPAWAHRPSLHEMQVKGALELAYRVAAYKERQTDSIHPVVTRAIASLVPTDEVTNKELAHILFGPLEQENKRAVRHFRNAERPLKLSTAAVYIQRLLHSKKIPPGEGGRLWYVVLLYASGMKVVNDYFRNNCGIDLGAFELDQVELISAACARFDFSLEASLKKSSLLPLPGYPLNDVRQFMDYCAFVHWQESKVKRNPLVGIRRLIDLTPDFNEYAFD